MALSFENVAVKAKGMNFLSLFFGVFKQMRAPSRFVMDGRILEERFESRENLVERVRDVAVAQGYLIRMKESRKEKVVIGCDRGGVYRCRADANAPRKRNRRSRLINCPFEIVGKRMDDGLWMIRMKNELHNHVPLKDIVSDPLLTRFSETDILVVKEMTAAGCEVRQVLAALKQKNPKLKATLRDVYNIKVKVRQKDDVEIGRPCAAASEGVRSVEDMAGMEAQASDSGQCPSSSQVIIIFSCECE